MVTVNRWPCSGIPVALTTKGFQLAYRSKSMRIAHTCAGVAWIGISLYSCFMGFSSLALVL